MNGEKNERIARFILAFLCLAAFAYTQAAFIAFFVHHFAVVGAALYLPLVMGWRADRPPALTARTSPSP